MSNHSLPSRTGVPKFFRFISERYPLISTKLSPSVVPRIDNLYLDMNGIVHNCARSSAGNGGIDSKRYASTATLPKTNQEIFLDVFKYIDNVVTLIPPEKLLFLAIDGVAPRAKMNQQRARRFCSALDRKTEHDRLSAEDPMYAAAAQEPFDSNCITPGTLFMQELTSVLQYYVAKKISEDRQWAGIEVVLSGAESPGEGEHKIMEYIRTMRESGRMQPNTRHCVYGLDADLIMLGLVTHEPHFFLLREKIDFNSWRKKSGPRVATSLDTAVFGEFELLSIGVFREYLASELGADNNSKLPFFDVERVTDDFVFIVILIGNDFLPNLPTMAIADGTLNVMLHLYKRALPRMGGYLTQSGKIVPERFEYFMAKLGMLDKLIMRGKLEAEEQANRGRKKGTRNTAVQNMDLDDVFGFKHTFANGESRLAAVRSMKLAELKLEAENINRRVADRELVEMKTNYYSQKFGKDFVSGDRAGLQHLTQRYIEGIWWVLRYYSEGCRHWRWFYPFHYAPFPSDISGIGAKLAKYELTTFTVDRPFRPLEQLLSVLPPVSSWCLPKPYRALMTSAASPIRDLYPSEFETDLNGKRNDWEAVVLLPFVSEERLLKAIATVPLESLARDEIVRNNHGPSFIYKMSLTSKVEQSSPFGTRLPSFVSNAKRTNLVLPKIPSGRPFSPRWLKGTLAPHANESLKDLPHLGAFKHRGRLAFVGLNIFGSPSRNETFVLDIEFDSNDATAASRRIGSKKTAEALGLSIESPVWFGYPWRVAGIIDFIADRSHRKRIGNTQGNGLGAGQVTAVQQTSEASYKRDSSILLSNWLQKYGVQLPPPQEIIGVKVDASENAMGQEDKAKEVRLCDTHFVRSRLSSKTSVGDSSKSSDVVIVGQTVVYVGSGSYFGQKAKVCSPIRNGTVKVEFGMAASCAREPAFGYRVVSISSKQRWMTVSKLSAAVNLPVSVLDTFLSSVLVQLQSGREKIDLGLGIKYIGRGLYIPGYARREEKHYYTFSEKTIDLLRRYRDAFPLLFETIGKFKAAELRAGNSRPRGNIVYNARDVFGASGKADDATRAAAAWISVQEVAKLPLVSVDAQVLPKETVAELEKHGSIVLALQDEYTASVGNVDVSKRCREVAREVLVTGNEGLDWGQNLSSGSFTASALVPSNASGLRLGDRVVNRMGFGGVPFGLRGTVVGIHPPSGTEGLERSNDNEMTGCTLIEVVFDEGFIGGSSLSGRCSDGRGKAVAAQSLFITRPDRENQFYVKNYARMAAKTAVTMKRNESENAATKAISVAIAKASVISYADALSKKGWNGKARLTADAAGFVPEAVASYKSVESGQAWQGMAKTVAAKVTHEVGSGTSLPRAGPRDTERHGANRGGGRQWTQGAASVGRGIEVKRDIGRLERNGPSGVDEATAEAARLTAMLKKELGISAMGGDEMVGKAVVGEMDRKTKTVYGEEGTEKDDLVVMWEQLQREAAGM